jgi:hypothetical protein
MMPKPLILLALGLVVASFGLLIPRGLPSVSAAAVICPVRQIGSPKQFNITKAITTPTKLRAAIIEYLNQGGMYSGLRSLTQDNTAGSVVPVDLNKDGIEEIVLSSSVFNEAWGLTSWVSIYQCKDGLYTATDFELEAGYIHAVTIVRVIDLMQMGYPQVYFQYQWIGSACTQSVIIVGWNGKSFVNFGEMPYLYCPATIRIFDYNQDGQREIYMRGMTAGNLESGVGRGTIQVYQWNTNAFQAIEKSYLPSPYRIHVLQDAQVALDQGDTFQAIALYEKAATRKYLKNERSVYEKDNDQDFAEQYQTAFANFRLVTLWLSIDRPHEAQHIIERMKTRYAPATPGDEFRELAVTFQTGFVGGQDRRSACAAVTAQIDKSYPYLAGYGYIGNWGTANIEYSNDDLCSFK